MKGKTWKRCRKVARPDSKGIGCGACVACEQLRAAYLRYSGETVDSLFNYLTERVGK